MTQEELSEYMDKVIVVDTKAQYIYIGTLKEVTEYFISLTEVDVHDHSEYHKTKELYIIEAAKFGIKSNRDKAKIVKSEVISLSLLSEIKTF